MKRRLRSMTGQKAAGSLLLGLALSVGFAGCLDTAHEDDLPVIQDKEVVLMPEGHVDPPVLSGSETEATVATALQINHTFEKDCFAGDLCDCWNFRIEMEGQPPVGSCQTLTCQNDSDCPAMEDCLGGICRSSCSQHSDCQAGQRCTSGQCEDLAYGDYDFCLAGDCDRDQGDCDSDSECKGTYLCYDNIGAQYGFAANVDVCLPPAGHADFCTNEQPCSVGQGDCDSDSQCDGFFNVCKNNIGAQFGMPSWVDVCQPLF